MTREEWEKAYEEARAAHEGLLDRRMEVAGQIRRLMADANEILREIVKAENRMTWLYWQQPQPQRLET